MPLGAAVRLATAGTMMAISAAICAACCAATAAAQQPYRVLDSWTVGGAGGWDYLTADPAAHRLYVTHGPRVEVLDLTSGKPVGAITGLKGTHGVALDEAGHYGYISDGGANSVVVFDRKTLETVASIPAGTNPDGILIEPVTKSVWAFNGRSKNVTVINAATQRVVATVDVPGKPEFPVADGRGMVYDNIETANEIVRFDARTHQLTATWALHDCDSPSGLAIDPAGHRLFAVCDNKHMAVVDTETGRQLASPAIGNGPDAAAFAATPQLAFSSNGEGTLSVLDAAHGYAVLETLPTAPGARTMAYDPAADRIYLATAQLGPAPEPTPQAPHPRPTVLPGTFRIIVVGRAQ